MLAAVLGGNALESFVAAVAFATILAVVSGLVLTGASAIAHDLYGEVFKKGKVTDKQQVLAARIASISVAVVSILLALGSEKLNVAFLVSLAFCVAAAANLPTILLYNLLETFQYNWSNCFYVDRVNRFTRFSCT